MPDFTRKQLPHSVPNWVADGEVYFITINCLPRGENQLAKEPVATAVLDAARHYESENKWHVNLWLLMPDHLHALVGFNTGSYSIQQLVRTFKAYLAKTQKIQWQRYFFDHRIRNDSEFEEKAHYIRQNPVRARFVKASEEWPYVYSN